eukprot:CAMPEP_0202890482 /NCGR_PEP_ID=MMETSP1392-20130828/866_1 /ASSEMBLY_ACC=CAM_ASM_000868 /TAXON_ID=225041 /ORGANISM="Chlamydomonas chlamydogama, Strain SAG 11-48b" /LENGTH=49 /DNA_ID= /DNA_START= /DNA_END= /DNA_ORIENTATION=
MAAILAKSAACPAVVARRPAAVKASLKPATVKAAPVAAPKADRMMVWQP